MEIRVIGTKDECEALQESYSIMEKADNVESVTISKLYPCRNNAEKFRLYINVKYK